MLSHSATGLVAPRTAGKRGQNFKKLVGGGLKKSVDGKDVCLGNNSSVETQTSAAFDSVKSNDSSVAKIETNTSATMHIPTEAEQSRDIQMNEDPEVLAKLQREIEATRNTIKQINEESNYYRQMSMDKQKQIINQKREARKKAASLQKQIEELAETGVVLKRKLDDANVENAEAMDAIVKCMEEHDSLLMTKNALMEEIQIAKESKNDTVEETRQLVKDLAESLEEALTILTQLLKDVEVKKLEVQAATREKNRLEAGICRRQLMSAESVEKDPDVLRVLRENRCGEEELLVLSDKVEKMIFKCSVLSQTNAQLKKQASMRGIQVTSTATEILDSNEQLRKLEQLCIDRYHKVIQKAKSYNSKGEPMNTDC